MDDLIHMLFATAFGPAGLCYQREPFILKQVFLPHPDETALLKRMGIVSSMAYAPHPAAQHLADMLTAYFLGERIEIPWQLMDHQQFTAAQGAVYDQVAGIPWGQVRSYGQIAAAAGRPGAARFVGRCMATNPYPVIIPCHRVVRSDGSLGGFGGGLVLKQRMLDLEAGCF